MKITRELIDNGQKIVHIDYEKKDIEKIEKIREETLKKLEEEKKKAMEQDSADPEE